MEFHRPSRGRRSIRLRGYDYSRPGHYFVTLCACERKSLFGEVVKGQLRLNEVGQMVHATWYEIPRHYNGIQVDAFVVMPNHLHGIVELTGQARGPAPTTSLPGIVQRYKSLTTARYRNMGPGQAQGSAPTKLWQRSYYEHIVRSEASLHKIREYILSNPSTWPCDRENPERAGDAEDEIENILTEDLMPLNEW